MRPRTQRLLLLLALTALFALALQASWLSDDAYITLRVVDNAVHGFGLRWNVAERVQVYTHPLWMLVLLVFYFFTREALYTTTLLSLALSMAAIVLLARRLFLQRPMRAVLFLLALCPSRSVLEFATSGLENPLALLLLVLLIERTDRITTQRDATIAVLLLSLLGLTRMDLLLLGGPLVLFRLRRDTFVRAVVIGSLPFLAWELFSLVYYGQLVPNTAWAKLATGIPRYTLLQQGTKYFRSIGWWDGWGTLLLATGSIVTLVTRRWLALGLALYAAYVWSIGGDFMVGRFFSTPIIIAAFCLFEARWGRSVQLAFIATLPLFFVDRMSGEQPTMLPWLQSKGGAWYRWGIVDERQFWGPTSGLFADTRARDLTRDPLYRFAQHLLGKPVVEESCIGMVGYYVGPSVHIIDPLGLPDPLIARLPVINPGEFRIGHFERDLPDGYMTTVVTHQPRLSDPDLNGYWRVLVHLSRGELFTKARWQAIAVMLSGRAEPMRLAYVARYRAKQAHK